MAGGISRISLSQLFELRICDRGRVRWESLQAWTSACDGSWRTTGQMQCTAYFCPYRSHHARARLLAFRVLLILVLSILGLSKFLRESSFKCEVEVSCGGISVTARNRKVPE
jgi:hypothetical protein